MWSTSSTEHSEEEKWTCRDEQTLKLLMGCHKFSLKVNSRVYLPLPLCCTRASTLANRPDCSSALRSWDNSEREQTKPGWQLSPAKSSSCTAEQST